MVLKRRVERPEFPEVVSPGIFPVLLPLSEGGGKIIIEIKVKLSSNLEGTPSLNSPVLQIILLK